MRALLRSKKGAIGSILTTIVDGIRSSITWTFNVMPLPLKFIIFLFILIGVASLFVPLLANSFGYHCDGSGTVWKLSGLQVFNNYAIMRNKPDLEDGLTTDIPLTCRALVSVPARISYCTNCTANGSFWFANDLTCITDGYRLPEYSSLLKRTICNTYQCAPPVGFFYNLSANLFQCKDAFCINKSLSDYNNLIYRIEGAAPVYFDQLKNYSSSHVVYFKCLKTNPLNIRLTFFGIDVFDFKIWLILMVLAIIVWFYGKIK